MGSRLTFSGFLLSLLLAITAVLSGCGGGGATAGNVTPDPLAVSPSAAVAYNGHPVTLYITGGTKPYTVTSSNSAVINVPYSVADSTVIFNASNVAEDTPVTLTMSDSKGVRTSSTITVKPSVINNTLTVTPDPATPGVGCGTAVCSGMMATVSVQLKNMATPLVNRNVRFEVIQGDYQFSTNAGATTFADSVSLTTDQNGYAYARIKANTGAPTQYAILKVTDIDGGSILQTTFTIAQYTDGTGILSVVPDTQTIIGPSKDVCSSGVMLDYIIHGGTPPYTVQSTSTGVATVYPSTVQTNGAGFTATTHSSPCPGTAIIDITDATGRVIQATLINGVGTLTPTTVAFFTTAPTEGVTIHVAPALGSSVTYNVGGGTAPYFASSANTSIATASISGSSLTITGAAAGGPVNITVTDSTGAIKTIAVTVVP